MVRGLDTFKKWFENYTDNYIIIGGTACDAALNDAGFNARATKDIDIILNIEALSESFVERFWDFVRAADYKKREQEIQKRNAYRFTNPTSPAYPTQIELFCRQPDALALPTNIHITPIPTEEGLSSLSAILLDDGYYNFTLQHSNTIDGVHYADSAALICLKAFAYLSNLKLRESGINIHSVNIDKHKNDIFRLLPLLPADETILLPASIKADMQTFTHLIANNLPPQQVLAQSGYGDMNTESVYQNLFTIFQL